jgi:glucitol operon activator protein
VLLLNCLEGIDMDVGFGLLLLVALVMSVGFTLYQQRTYQNATKRLGLAYLGAKNHFLVSGRGKGFLRGAIVLLVVNGDTRRIVAAEAMIGSTALARFKPHPELVGDLDTAPHRATEKKLSEAIVYATSQYEVTSKRSVRFPASTK